MNENGAVWGFYDAAARFFLDWHLPITSRIFFDHINLDDLHKEKIFYEFLRIISKNTNKLISMF
jgi:hypothetical protein